ncbi:MAG: hypothetical protein Q4A07_10685 [Coriobacteriales bacterium]|nr:hypothetical protein [Coriobacteriales bacterium]
MHRDYFVEGTERLVNPVTAGSVHFLQPFFGALPKRIQHKVLDRSSKTTPYMGFVVDPYALFVFYEVRDVQAAESMLPEGFSLARARAFEGDEERFYAIQGFFRVRTSVFWGSRAELYLVARNQRTGLLSWVIVDYLSDTVSYDRAFGLRAPSAPQSVVTTTADARVVVDVKDPKGERASKYDVSLRGATMRRLDERLWLEGNLSIGYGPQLSPDDPAVFSLTFRPEEMTEALDIPALALEHAFTSWCGEVLDKDPACVVCFPFAQHLLCDSPGSASEVGSIEELRRRAGSVDFNKVANFSMASTRKAVVGSALACALLIVGLVVALVLK